MSTFDDRQRAWQQRASDEAAAEGRAFRGSEKNATLWIWAGLFCVATAALYPAIDLHEFKEITGEGLKAGALAAIVGLVVTVLGRMQRGHYNYMADTQERHSEAMKPNF